METIQNPFKRSNTNMRCADGIPLPNSMRLSILVRWALVILVAMAVGPVGLVATEPTLYLEARTCATNATRYGREAFTNKFDAYGNVKLFRVHKHEDRRIDITVNTTTGTSFTNSGTNILITTYSPIAAGAQPCASNPEPSYNGDGEIIYQYRVNSYYTSCREFYDGYSYTETDPPLCWLKNSLSHTTSSQSISETELIDNYSQYIAGNSEIESSGGVKQVVQTLTNAYPVEELVNTVIVLVSNQLSSIPEWRGTRSASARWLKQDSGRCADATVAEYRIVYNGDEGDEVSGTLTTYTEVIYHDNRKETNLVSTPITKVCLGYPVVETNTVFLLPPAGASIVSSVIQIKMEECSSCKSCASNSKGKCSVTLGHKASVKFGAGNSFLYAAGSAVGESITDPASIQWFSPNGEAEVLGEGRIEQVKTSSGLVTVSEGSGNGYTVAFYTGTPTYDSATKRYTTSNLTLENSYTVSVPSGSPNTVVVNGTDGFYSKFSYSNETWYRYEATSGGGDVLVQSKNLVKDQNGFVTQSQDTWYENGQAVTSESTFTYSADSNTGQAYISAATRGSGTNSVSSEWHYYTEVGPESPYYRKPSLIVEPSGAWKRFEYDPQNGRLTKTIFGLGNQPTNALENTVRVEEYTYTPFHSWDSGEYNADSPRGIYTKYKGTMVRMTGHVYGLNRHIEIQYPKQRFSGSLANPTQECLQTTNMDLFFSSGTGSKTAYPDGTVNLSYSITNADNTYRTNISMRGVLAASGAIVQGSKTFSVLNAQNGETIATTNFVIAAGQEIVIASDNYTYTSDAYRSYSVTHLDGTTESFVNGCCGLLSSTDRDKVTTTYGYDLQGKYSISTRLGIMTSNRLDSAGRVLEVWRWPSDNSGPTNIANYTYDVAGRVRTTTDALGNVTTNIYVVIDDFRVTKTDYPNGARKEEWRNRDGSLAKEIGSAIFPVAYSYDVDTTLGEEFTQTTKLDADGNATGEWVKTYTDEFGRGSRTVYAALPGESNPYTLAQYNLAGQKAAFRDADGNWTLYKYTASGELYETVIDMDGDATQDNNVDRTTRTETAYVDKNGVKVRQTKTYLLPLAQGAVEDSIVEETLDGNTRWVTRFSQTTKTERVWAVDGSYTVKTIAPDSSYAIQTYISGRLDSVNYYKPTGDTPIRGQRYFYDAHGRRWKTQDLRNGFTTYAFDQADRVVAVTNPPAATDQAPLITQTRYDAMGRATNVVYPDNTTQITSYYPNGLVKVNRGSRTYPVFYAYDPQGRMTNMTTWQITYGEVADAMSAARTSWQYDSYRGLLQAKRYHGGAGPTYEYTPGGRLSKRTWVRGGGTVYTQYGYNRAGEVNSINYSDSTPAVTVVHDRRGYVATNLWDTNILLRTVHPSGVVLSEKLNGLEVRNQVDGFLRHNRHAVLTPNEAVLFSADYSFDEAGRLKTVYDGTHVVEYGYLANSALIEQVGYQQNSQTRMTATRQYDYLNRLTSVSATDGAAQPNVLARFEYGLNAASQRTSITNADGSRWVYTYDALGQVTSGRKLLADGTPVAGQQFDYTFDDIGNRKSATTDGSGGAQSVQTYTVDLTKQITSRTVPGFVNVLGTANSSAFVAVNNQQASRQGEYWRTELPVNNTTGAVWLSLMGQATRQSVRTNWTGEAFVPATPETFTYDADGNLTSDGRWTYTWDAENRLIRQETLAAAYNSGVPRQRLEYDYDPQGRRIAKRVYSGGVYSLQYQLRYAWQDWNLLAEVNSTNFNLVRGYAWGLDLSGTKQGAGGVGGLLWVKDAVQGTHFAFADGNGNVVLLVAASTGAYSAQYEYGPFGEQVRASGPMAKANPFRFSTKYKDDETGFLYYGFRYYNPSPGRWLSRDPIEEKGGLNIFGFCHNNATYYFDADGGNYVPYPGWYPPPMPTGGGKISFCRREFDNPDGLMVCANRVCGMHSFLKIEKGGKTEGWGFGPGGTGGEDPHLVNDPKVKCRTCSVSLRTLKYGKGKGKPGTQATDEEIWECLKARPAKNPYDTLTYNCWNYAIGAAFSCGLECTIP